MGSLVPVLTRLVGDILAVEAGCGGCVPPAALTPGADRVLLAEEDAIVRTADAVHFLSERPEEISAALLWHALRFTRSRELAEDAVGDVLCKLCKVLNDDDRSRVKSGPSLLGRLKCWTKNRVCDLKRRARAEQRRREAAVRRRENLQPAEVPEETGRLLYIGFQRLSEDERIAISAEIDWIAGLNESLEGEIGWNQDLNEPLDRRKKRKKTQVAKAERLGWTHGQYTRRLFKARKKLAAFLEPFAQGGVVPREVVEGALRIAGEYASSGSSGPLENPVSIGAALCACMAIRGALAAGIPVPPCLIDLTARTLDLTDPPAALALLSQVERAIDLSKLPWGYQATLATDRAQIIDHLATRVSPISEQLDLLRGALSTLRGVRAPVPREHTEWVAQAERRDYQEGVILRRIGEVLLRCGDSSGVEQLFAEARGCFVPLVDAGQAEQSLLAGHQLAVLVLLEGERAEERGELDKARCFYRDAAAGFEEWLHEASHATVSSHRLVYGHRRLGQSLGCLGRLEAALSPAQAEALRKKASAEFAAAERQARLVGGSREVERITREREEALRW